MKTRMTAALLALALALGLTGCKKSEDKAAELVFQSAPYYIQEEMTLPAGSGELVGCCTDGESIWYLAIPGEDEAPVLCRVPLDGGEAEVLAEYQAPMEGGEPAVGYVGPVLGGDGKLWVWEQFLVSGGETRQVFHMRQLDPETGGELGVADITEAMEDMSLLSLNGMAVDENGTIFLADQKHVAAVDGQGQTLYTLKARTSGTFFSAGAGGSLALLPDGTVGVLTVKADDERTVKAIDRETKDWSGKEYSIHKNVERIYPGRGECAFYYINDNTVYGIVPKEKQSAGSRSLPRPPARRGPPAGSCSHGGRIAPPGGWTPGPARRAAAGQSRPAGPPVVGRRRSAGPGRPPALLSVPPSL